MVERDVSNLRTSLAALAKDLRAPVARPSLRELDEVADGIAALAEELDGAQKERERLTAELRGPGSAGWPALGRHRGRHRASRFATPSPR